MIELKLYPSKKKALGFLLIQLLLTLADVFIIYNGNNNWKAWMGLVLFSSCTIVFLFRLYSDEPDLIINATGVTGKSISNKTFNWEYMKEAYLHKVNNLTFICLVMDEKEAPSKDETGLRKDMIEINKELLGVGDVNLNVGSLVYDKKKILQLMLALIRCSDINERKKVLNNFLLID